MAEDINQTYPRLTDVVGYLDTQLRCHEFQRQDSALNGLQVGNTQNTELQLQTIVAAVDASLESFERAADLSANLLIVHHGIFWGSMGAITGPLYQRLCLLQEKQLALYAAHLPLDAHMQYGNNIHLAESLNPLGLGNIRSFGTYKGHAIGCIGEFSSPQSMDDICHILNIPPNALRLEFSRRAKSCGITTMAIVSGAGAFTLEEAVASGCDLLLTGEFIHQYYYTAKELGINVLAMGHYQSEMGGVLRLLQMLKQQWPAISSHFIDLPTGL